MSQLIVILFLVIAVVRAVTKSRGQGAKPPQKPVSIGQETETVDDAPEPRRAKARKHGRAARPEVRPEPAVQTEGYAERPRRESPSVEPIACGNAQEHSHAHAAEAAVTVDDLRRAVITSEILSKPVSLRDE